VASLKSAFGLGRAGIRIADFGLGLPRFARNDMIADWRSIIGVNLRSSADQRALG
jgi:hypothetical protein